jgi:WD40 repeat protein
MLNQIVRLVLWGTCCGLLIATTLHAADSPPLYALAVSPDGKSVATGSKAGAIAIYEMDTDKKVAALTVGQTIYSLAYSPDGQSLAAGCGDRRVRIFAVERHSLLEQRSFECRGTVFAVAFSPKRNLLAAGVEGSGTIHLFDIAEGKLLCTIWEPANLISSLAFAPDDTALASAGVNFKVWDVRPEVLAKIASERLDLSIDELRANGKKALKWESVDGSEYAAGVAISPDGKRVAGVTGIGGPNTGGKTLSIWDITSGRRLKAIRSKGMTTIVFTHDCQRVITGSDEGMVRVWNSETGSLANRWSAHSGAIRSIALVPGSDRLATVGDDGALKLWDWTTGELIDRHWAP